MRSTVLVLSALVAFSALAEAQTPMDIEPVKELKPTGSLATCVYKPVNQEQPYFSRLARDEVSTGSFLAPYSLQGKKGKYVSWYGIVRGKTTSADGTLTLLLQHNYFDGMTDCHIMLVSYSGGGDFLATLHADPSMIPALALVRVYGKVVDEKDKLPKIEVEYLRLWPWLAFTFTDLGGDDKGNPRWKKYNTLKTDRVYRPYPNMDYYRAVLGNPGDFESDSKPQ